MVSRVEIRNLLQSLQGNYLRAAVGAMKTTPMEALEVVLYQTPLDLAAVEAAGHCIQIKMSERMEEYRVRLYKVQIPPEIPLHIKPG
jgi:hypothetical protein